MNTLSTPSGTKKCAQCAEEIKSEAQVCRFCGAHYDVRTTGYCSTCHGRQPAGDAGTCTVCGGGLVDVAVESRYAGTPPAPDAPAAPAAAGTTRRRGAVRALGAVLILLVTAGVIGYIFWSQLVAEAQDPMELVDRFDEAGIECIDLEQGTDFGDTKSVWCGIKGPKSLLVMTWRDDVDVETYLDNQCDNIDENPLSKTSGALVVGDKWIIDVQHLVTTGDTSKATANRLAEVLDGQVRTYDCRR